MRRVIPSSSASVTGGRRVAQSGMVPATFSFPLRLIVMSLYGVQLATPNLRSGQHACAPPSVAQAGVVGAEHSCLDTADAPSMMPDVVIHEARHATAAELENLHSSAVDTSCHLRQRRLGLREPQ